MLGLVIYGLVFIAMNAVVQLAMLIVVLIGVFTVFARRPKQQRSTTADKNYSGPTQKDIVLPFWVRRIIWIKAATGAVTLGLMCLFATGSRLDDASLFILPTIMIAGLILGELWEWLTYKALSASNPKTAAIAYFNPVDGLWRRKTNLRQLETKT